MSFSMSSCSGPGFLCWSSQSRPQKVSGASMRLCRLGDIHWLWAFAPSSPTPLFSLLDSSASGGCVRFANVLSSMFDLRDVICSCFLIRHEFTCSLCILSRVSPFPSFHINLYALSTTLCSLSMSDLHHG